MIYVNSTLPAEMRNQGTGSVPPIHYWSYRPTPADKVVHHRSNRYEIRLRALLKSWDPVVFSKVFRAMKDHQGRLYLVTQPDLIGALPILASRFSQRKIVTWTWMPSEVEKWNRSLGVCDHVLCLTQPALDAMAKAHPSVSASLGYWEVDADYYRSRHVTKSIEVDVALVGRTRRDIAAVQNLLASELFSVGCSARTKYMYTSAIKVQKSDDDVLSLLGSSACTLIYFEGPTEEPLGYTNLVEALACGCAVVIPEDSSIPEEVLRLPGIYRFDRRDICDAKEKVKSAVEFGRDPAKRLLAQSACFDVLGVGVTRAQILTVFGRGG